MYAMITRVLQSVGSLFRGGDNILWLCDRDIYTECEEDVADESRIECLMQMTRGFVFSMTTEGVKSWIAFFRDSLDKSTTPLQTREKLYLLAVGHYKIRDYEISRQYLEHCLETAPDWLPARALKTVVGDRITKDSVLGLKIATTAMGLALCGIVAAIARRR